MTTRTSIAVFTAAVAVLAFIGTSFPGVRSAAAQAFGPPMTLYGSVADSAGPIDAGLPVEAFIGEVSCGKGKTETTGEGAGQVTAYVVDVVTREQKAGCGSLNAEVRVQIGDRFAIQTARWNAGPIRVDVTFGDATPAPIPTFTPTPTRTPGPDATPTPPNSATPGGSPAASATQESATPANSATGAARTATTLRGGVIRQDQSGSGDGSDSGGGFPIWAAVVLVLGAIAVVGGGAGFMLSRSRSATPEDADSTGA